MTSADITDCSIDDIPEPDDPDADDGLLTLTLSVDEATVVTEALADTLDNYEAMQRYFDTLSQNAEQAAAGGFDVFTANQMAKAMRERFLILSMLIEDLEESIET